jgi:hypothetical protein
MGGRKWTSNEIDCVKKHYANDRSNYCSTNLDRTDSAIRSQANKLGLSKHGLLKIGDRF